MSVPFLDLARETSAPQRASSTPRSRASSTAAATSSRTRSTSSRRRSPESAARRRRRRRLGHRRDHDRAAGGRRRAGGRGDHGSEHLRPDDRRDRAGGRVSGPRRRRPGDVHPRPRRGRARRDVRERRRSCRCTSTASPRTWTRCSRLRHGLRVVEDCAQAHGAALGRPPGRTRSATRPRSASTRPRTSARSATRARSSRTIAERRRTRAAAPQLRRAGALRARAAGPEQPARRAPGRDPVGEAAARSTAAVERRRRARRSLRRRTCRHGRRRARDGRGARARLPPLCRPGRPTATRSARRSTSAGVGTAVHYPTPVHRQPAYRDLDVPGGFPVAEALCERVVSLPLSETHTDDEIAFAADAARAAAR